MTIAMVWGKEVRFMSLAEKIIGMWDHFVLVIGSLATTRFTSLCESHRYCLVAGSALVPPAIVRIDVWAVRALFFYCGRGIGHIFY
jgi:hypothetical protein